MGSPEYFVGPREAPTEYRHREMFANYEGVRTRLVTGTRDFLRWFHRRMNAVWDYARTDYEHQEFDSEHGTPGMGRTLEFHMDAFGKPLPRPALWHHADVYPSFEVWDWQVETDRRKPGYTVLENVSKAGFRSVVREWVPGGALMPGVTVRIATAPVYEGEITVTVDGRTSKQRAEGGRLRFTLDGGVHEVAIGDGPHLTIAAATMRKVTVLNKGPTASEAGMLGLLKVPRLAAGERVEIPVNLAPNGEVYAVRTPQAHAFVPVYREDAPLLADYVVEENGAFALRDGQRLELFTEDACVDNTERVTVIHPEMSGLMEHYSLPKIPPGCRPAFFARWLELHPPEHTVREAWIRK
jgi:hypothetical protein